nr:MAG TPA: hypothetical protein [Caudoviricetes sp.]
MHAVSCVFLLAPHTGSTSLTHNNKAKEGMKKADRLLTYRLLVCFSLAFDSLYYSTGLHTMQCVFSPI